MAHPATEKRGGNPDVKHKPEHQKPKDAMERKLEQGLEESMSAIGSKADIDLDRHPVRVTNTAADPSLSAEICHRHSNG